MAKPLKIDFSIPKYLENSINTLCKATNENITRDSAKDIVSKDIHMAVATGDITVVQSSLLQDYYISGEMFSEIELPEDVQDDIDMVIYLRYVVEKNGSEIGDVLNYRNQLMMFLSSIKIALMNGEISQDTFHQLKEKYMII